MEKNELLKAFNRSLDLKKIQSMSCNKIVEEFHKRRKLSTIKQEEDKRGVYLTNFKN